MPALQRTAWEFDGPQYEWGRFYSLDWKCRCSFVDGIKYFALPPSVEEGSPDPVSCAIRKLTRHCKEISLQGIFHPSLFDPPTSGPGADEQPCWQSTTRLRVIMHPCSPDGNWILHPWGHREAPHRTRYEKYQRRDDITLKHELPVDRWIPDAQRLDAMITAFARCCARMPALKVADLRFEAVSYYHNMDYDQKPFQVIFIAAFHRMDYWKGDSDENPCSCCRFYMHLGYWRLERETMAELEAVGMKRGGDRSTIHFLPWGEFYGEY
ncbi:hypothetical protein F5Y14DRAFT_442184 [Nemania sp. NC0429]|nr:hypothetical protein F5Y14DRAFT_442184 [Nemania sp. NC0429]